MSSPSLTTLEALKEAYASATNNLRIIDTIEIQHPSIVPSIYLAKDYRPNDLDAEQRQKFTAVLENGTSVDFICVPFNIEKPDIDTTPVPEITISIENVSRILMPHLQNTAQSLANLTVIYRPYIETINTEPAASPLKLLMSKVKVTKKLIIASCRAKNIGNLKFPGKKYQINTFPHIR